MSRGRVLPSSSSLDEYSDGADDVVFVSGQREIDTLPHLRDSCTTHAFASSPYSQSHANFCSLCYCFVCDAPVPECPRWATFHCHAHSSDPNPVNKQYWRDERRKAQAIKNAGDPSKKKARTIGEFFAKGTEGQGQGATMIATTASATASSSSSTTNSANSRNNSKKSNSSSSDISKNNSTSKTAVIIDISDSDEELARKPLSTTTAKGNKNTGIPIYSTVSRSAPNFPSTISSTVLVPGIGASSSSSSSKNNLLLKKLSTTNQVELAKLSNHAPDIWERLEDEIDKSKEPIWMCKCGCISWHIKDPKFKISNVYNHLKTQRHYNKISL